MRGASPAVASVWPAIPFTGSLVSFPLFDGRKIGSETMRIPAFLASGSTLGMHTLRRTSLRSDRLRLGKTQINLVLHSACTIFVDMMEFLETYHLVGIVVGAATFLIIGVFHPFVIKGEYYFGVRCWWAFAVSGVAALAASLWVENLILSILLAVWGASSLWGIGELFEQRERVAKGWFPKREKKNRRGGR